MGTQAWLFAFCGGARAVAQLLLAAVRQPGIASRRNVAWRRAAFWTSAFLRA